jgi:hypothetical protein
MAEPFFRRRDVVAALAAATIIALTLNIWFNTVTTPENIDSYMWLARLNEPAGRAAECMARFFYPRIGYPSNVRCALALGYPILVGLWVLPILTAITIGRFTISRYRGRAKRAC